MKLTWTIVIVLAALTSSLSAQNLSRLAELVGGGDPNHGKCTVEVVVDGAAEIQVRGNTASMRDLSGQPPQWRRFQCTSPMPANPGNIRLVAVDGRGRQQLVQDPRNGGGVTVHIEDSDGGAGTYTFDLMWIHKDQNKASPDRKVERLTGASREIPIPTVTSITASGAEIATMAAI
jgi:hypothetical protein